MPPKNPPTRSTPRKTDATPAHSVSKAGSVKTLSDSTVAAKSKSLTGPAKQLYDLLSQQGPTSRSVARTKLKLSAEELNTAIAQAGVTEKKRESEGPGRPATVLAIPGPTAPKAPAAKAATK